MATLTTHSSDNVWSLNSQFIGMLGGSPQVRREYWSDLPGTRSEFSQHSLDWYAGGDLATSLRGDFTFDGSGQVEGISGTVTSVLDFYYRETEAGSFIINFYSLLEVTGFSVADYFNTLTIGDVFSGNDLITGTNSAVGDELFGFAGFDTIYGGNGNDLIQGGMNGDRIFGQIGNDDLRGGNGLDYIEGGTGNDVIRGALGTDTLMGGEGADTFVFEKALDNRINIDTILDFEHGIDKIQLSSSIFTAFAGEQGSPLSIGEHIIFNNRTRELTYYPEGFGPGEALVFARLGADSDVPTLGDFWITA